MKVKGVGGGGACVQIYRNFKKILHEFDFSLSLALGYRWELERPGGGGRGETKVFEFQIVSTMLIASYLRFCH